MSVTFEEGGTEVSIETGSTDDVEVTAGGGSLVFVVMFCLFAGAHALSTGSLCFTQNDFSSSSLEIR